MSFKEILPYMLLSPLVIQLAIIIPYIWKRCTEGDD